MNVMERVTESGIILPPRNNSDALWPQVTLATDVTGLAFNVAINHETDEGKELFTELAKRIERAQLLLAGGDVPDPIELIAPHDGTTYWLTAKGIEHVTAVCESYAQHVDISATEMKGKITYKRRQDVVPQLRPA